MRVFVAVGLGTAAFTMQDILLEPYGGEILKLTVGETTALTALFAGGTLAGFALAARRLGAVAPIRIASPRSACSSGSSRSRPSSSRRRLVRRRCSAPARC